MEIDFLLSDYKAVTKRNAQGLPALPLTVEQVVHLVQLCQNPPIESIHSLKNLLIHRIEPGLNEAAYLKATFLSDVAKNNIQTPLLTPQQAIQILGTMWGGYNVSVLSELLDYPDSLAQQAHDQLARNVFLFNIYYDIVDQYQRGNIWASKLLQQFAQEKWLKHTKSWSVPIQGIVFKIAGLTNARAISPVQDAWTRRDIPLHAQAFLKDQYPNALKEIEQLKAKGQPIICVMDQIVLENTSNAHCEAALNSLSWIFGEKIPYFPNRAYRGIIIGQNIDTPFQKWAAYNGMLCMKADTRSLQTGDVIKIDPDKSSIFNQKGTCIKTWVTQKQWESWQVGGALLLQLGRVLTQKARDLLREKQIFSLPKLGKTARRPHYSLAQKMIGRACGIEGIKPKYDCEPYFSVIEAPQMHSLGYTKISTLPAMGLSSALVVEPFQHPNVIPTQKSFLNALERQGCVMLKPGDGMVHAWLNRLLLPGEVGVGTHAYTGFPVGFGFSIEQTAIPFAACIGTLPFTMPESILVRFSGDIQPGITLRDLVYAIPYVAQQKGLLIPESTHNIFANRIIEITGLSKLTTEQAFEFNEASIDWGAMACVIHFTHSVLKAHVQSGIKLLHWMIEHQYQDIRTLRRRIIAMQAWLKKNEMLNADSEAEYAATMDIDLNKITEPLVASFKRPQHVQPLSTIATTAIDEVFIGGAEMHLGNYRAVGEMIRHIARPLKVPLWLTPASKLEALQLMQEGYYALYADKGVHTGMPDNNLCMSTQVSHAGTIVTTTKRAFLKNNIQPIEGYLCSPELASVIAILGYVPMSTEYQKQVSLFKSLQASLDRPLDFYFAAYDKIGS